MKGTKELLEDVVSTIDTTSWVTNVRKESSESAATIFRRVEEACLQYNFSQFDEAIVAFNSIFQTSASERTSSIDISGRLMQYNFDELYSRTVKSSIRKLARCSGNNLNATYSEIRPSGLTHVLERLGLRDSSIFIDIGASVGIAVLCLLTTSLTTSRRS